MTTTDLPLVVVDTCCFVSYLTDDKPERTSQVEYLLGEHGKSIEIVVPSVVELELFGKYPQVKSSGNQKHRVRLLQHAQRWFVGQSYLVAELDRKTVDRGIDLMREFSIHGIDASILATALLYGATHVYTYDAKMLAVAGRIEGLSIGVPPEPETLF